MPSYEHQQDSVPTTILYGRPRVRFAMVDSGGLSELAEAPADRIGDVLAFFGSDKPDQRLDQPFDSIVFAGSRVIAVIMHRDGQVPEVRRLDLAPEAPADA